ncbi:MAG TPA: amidohydrolase family protein, partial [Chitinophagaceae bacterium]|nr:amidohydrolase family protein [Chitinophagaceae bacterium]
MIKTKSTFIAFLFIIYNQLIFAQVPDLILTNGKIFTSDTNNLYAEALAIKGERILAVGTTVAIDKLANAKTKRIDLQGKTVIPGINDAHDHIGYSSSVGRFIQFTEPMLPGPTIEQVLDSISKIVKQVPKGTLIQGNIGLRIIEDSGARRAVLDKVSPDHPVLLNAPWGHGTLVNTLAMQKLGISVTAKDPVGGYYERIKDSKEISGLLREYAEFSVKRQWYATVANKTLIDAFKSYSDTALRFGITSVQNMATALELDKSVAVLKAANIPLRVRVIRFPGSSATGRETAKWSTPYPSSSTLKISGIKWILDA